MNFKFSIFESLLRRKNKPNNQETINRSTHSSVVGHPAQREWNDRYMNMAQSIRNWQIAFLLTMVLALGLLVQVIRLSSASRIQPLAVETCQGLPRHLLPITTHLPNKDQLVDYALTQFIMNARTIIADSEAQKALLNKVYAYSADRTLAFLHDFYQKNNPFVLSGRYTTQVSVLNTLPISDHTWQITWEESQTGAELASVNRFVATLTYRFGAVNPKWMNDNPFGIYVTAVSWSPLPTRPLP